MLPLIFLFLGLPVAGSERVIQDQISTSRCVTCHKDLSERLAKPVSRSSGGAHALSKIGCSECHGGDPGAQRGGPAHAGFAGHPAASEIGAFCGRCHQEAQSSFLKSGHAKLRGTRPANSCVDCHGAHDVGNPPALFRLSEYCGSCHGVEYLPPLPADLIKLMVAVDKLSSARQRKMHLDKSWKSSDATLELRRSIGALLHRGSLEVTPDQVRAWVVRLERFVEAMKK